MATLALSFCVLYAIALFGLGDLVLRRRTGVGCWSRAASPVEHRANMLVLAAWLLDLLGPALVLLDALEPLFGGAEVAGAVLCCLSLGLGLLAQRTMRSAWRTSIDPGRPSELVRGGLFALVRNPVYTTMVGISLGAFLLVPTAAGAIGVAVCVVGVQIQTRLVEEPHLRALHGAAYEDYAARVGRFVPGAGRLRQTPHGLA